MNFGLTDICDIATSVRGIDVLRAKNSGRRFGFLRGVNNFTLQDLVQGTLYDDGTVLWFSSLSDCMLAADILKIEGYTHILLTDDWLGNERHINEPFCLLTNCSSLNFISMDQRIFDAYFLINFPNSDVEYFNSDMTEIFRDEYVEKLAVFFKEETSFSIKVSVQDSGILRVDSLSGSWDLLNKTKTKVENNLNCKVEIVVCSW